MKETIAGINKLPVKERNLIPHYVPLQHFIKRVDAKDKNLYDNCQLFKFGFTFKDFAVQYNFPKNVD